MKLTTVHSKRSHQAIIDGVWASTENLTEISLVQELQDYGIIMRDAKLIDTDTNNGVMTHQWSI